LHSIAAPSAHAAPAATVLLVEDDMRLARSVVRALAQASFQVWHAENAADARAILRHHRPYLVVLDLSLPDVDGLVFCTWLRSETPELPILACSQGAVRERVLCLQLGAEDVLGKPFDMQELEARARAIVRRAHTVRTARRAPPGPHLLGSLHIDLGRWCATLNGRRLHLTPTEFQLIVFLAQHAGQVISRQEVARAVWGNASMSRSRTVDAYVRRIRAKLSGPGAPQLMTVQGYGFVLVAPMLTSV
jgi:DNA-binding response OmpR family regulator